jgi:hypothetical protein
LKENREEKENVKPILFLFLFEKKIFHNSTNVFQKYFFAAQKFEWKVNPIQQKSTGGEPQSGEEGDKPSWKT